MRVLVATDGSASAQVAIDLMSRLPWPGGSVIRVITSLDTIRLAGPWTGLAAYDPSDLEEEVLAELEDTVRQAMARLAPTGAELEGEVLLGRPPSVIAEQAATFGADLIVVGSRGQGPIRTMLLGSVSAEVVDQAHCPVLVCRRPTLERLLLAHDGSPHARAAEDVVADWSILGAVPVEVLSVVRTHERHTETIEPLAGGRSAVAYRDALDESRRHHEDVCQAAVERLQAAGRTATWEVRAGDPARVLVDEAETRGVDLVVMGTHGRTGLARLRLGSVARNVLTHAHCSVLIVRDGRSPSS